MAINKSLMILLGVLGLVAVGAIAFAGGADAGEVVSEGMMTNPDTDASASWKVTKRSERMVVGSFGEMDVPVFYAHFQLAEGSLMTLSDAEDNPVKYGKESEARAEVLSSLAEQGYTEAPSSSVFEGSRVDEDVV